jgi:tetratricopeptide (TPR) repeat protein
MRWFVPIVVALSGLPALAQAQDSGEISRNIAGFAADGRVVVRATAQGERIVDGASKQYYYELDELWDPRLAVPLDAHRRGDATGFEHPGWKKAKEEPLTFDEAVGGQTSPDGKHLLVTLTQTNVNESESGKTCTTTARTLLMSQEARATFVVAEASEQGPVDPGQPNCPEVTDRITWSRDSKRFAAERRFDGEFAVVAGTVDNTGSYAQRPFQSGRAIDPLGELEVGPLRTAWEALLAGDNAAAAAALETLEGTPGPSGWAALARGWHVARQGDASKARSAARDAASEVKGDPVGQAMLGGLYALAGDTRRVKRTLDTALKSADSWKSYVRMARILENVDLSLFNQVLVYGLSTEDGKANAEPQAWRTLIDGLVDAGLADKGEALLDRIPKGDAERAGAEARLAVGAGAGQRAEPLARAMTWADPGNCDGYLLTGRAALLKGEPAAALDLLEAAAFCDPRAGEAFYFLAELHRAAGRAPEAIAAAESYLEVSPPRKNDDVRTLRRARAQSTIDRLAVDGLGLVSLTCRALGANFLCQGVVVNSGASPVEGATASIRRGETELGRSDLPTVPPLETRSFGIRIETLEDAVFTVGRDDDERARNTVDNLKLGW